MVEGHAARPVRVIGVDLCQPSFFSDQKLYQKMVEADARDAALVDTRSKPTYGFAKTVRELQNQHIELNGQRLPVLMQFELGTDFANDGTLLMSERVQQGYFPWRSPTGNPLDMVDIGLLHVEAKSRGELDQIAETIRQLAPLAVDVKRTEQFVTREKDFWANNTPIGKIFMIGTIMGLVVGAIICYQIQFTDISEHMPEFATLKAMGYGPRYFWCLILCQSFYLACLGFVPGILVSQGLYFALAESSGLVMSMTLERIGYVWLLTLLMCIVSGVLAIRKLFNTDPASLF
jgi:putative ABC transport system permease protein